MNENTDVYVGRLIVILGLTIIYKHNILELFYYQRFPNLRGMENDAYRLLRRLIKLQTSCCGFREIWYNWKRWHMRGYAPLVIRRRGRQDGAYVYISLSRLVICILYTFCLINHTTHFKFIYLKLNTFQFRRRRGGISNVHHSQTAKVPFEPYIPNVRRHTPPRDSHENKATFKPCITHW